MRRTEECASWVVYRMTVHGKQGGASAVCEQGEWDTMERARPGHHTLILAGIPTEAEAERVARGAQAAPDRRPRKQAGGRRVP
jgi:hypothetical protein